MGSVTISASPTSSLATLWRNELAAAAFADAQNLDGAPRLGHALLVTTNSYNDAAPCCFKIDSVDSEDPLIVMARK